MINFCKKIFYTLFNTTQEDSSANNQLRGTPLLVTDCGVGLNFLATSTEIPKTNNVIESSSCINFPVKHDLAETGLKALNNDDTDKLASCTESLGFESCNEKILNNAFENSGRSRASENLRKFDKKNNDIKRKSFPPPLSSFNENNKPTFSLRQVRNNGRLELTEVKINRPKSLRASRENGRLRLYLVKSDHKKDYVIPSIDAVKEKSSDSNDEKVLKGLNFPTSSGGGEDCPWVEVSKSSITCMDVDNNMWTTKKLREDK